MTFACRLCGKESEKHHPTQLYCSQSCRQRDYLKRKRNGLKTAPKPFSAPSVKKNTSESFLMNGAENGFADELFINGQGRVSKEHQDMMRYGGHVIFKDLIDEALIFLNFDNKTYRIKLTRFMDALRNMKNNTLL